MAQVINTNALSLVAQNNLNKSQSSLSTAIERLSSGSRINSAKDDAAGQAIGNRFSASITGLTQASRNANDGISLAQTTEGALNEINDNLQNIRRLTVQAQNGTNSDSDRESIQNEITARLSEINRISEQTEFNGVKVLSDDQALAIQVGANDGQTIDIELKQVNASTLGMDGFSVQQGVDPSTLTATTKVDLEVKYADFTIDDSGATPITTGIDEVVEDSANNKIYVKSGGNYYEATATADGELQINSDNNNNTAVTTAKGNGTITDVSAEIKTVTKNVDVSNLDANSSLVTDGENYYVKDANGELTKAKVDDQGVVTDTGKKVAQGDAATEDPLTKIDEALAMVDEMRSALGATQNRFNSVVSNLNSTVNNLSESRSRIVDADFATEVSNMSRAQILQQAGTTVLAQANQVPQNVLSLLR